MPDRKDWICRQTKIYALYFSRNGRQRTYGQRLVSPRYFQSARKTACPDTKKALRMAEPFIDTFVSFAIRP